jgi:hypothetical protein
MICDAGVILQSFNQKHAGSNLSLKGAAVVPTWITRANASRKTLSIETAQ